MSSGSPTCGSSLDLTFVIGVCPCPVALACAAARIAASSSPPKAHLPAFHRALPACSNPSRAKLAASLLPICSARAIPLAIPVTGSEAGGANVFGNICLAAFLNTSPPPNLINRAIVFS